MSGASFAFWGRVRMLEERLRQGGLPLMGDEHAAEIVRIWTRWTGPALAFALEETTVSIESDLHDREWTFSTFGEEH